MDLKQNLERLKELTEKVSLFSEMSNVEQNRVDYQTVSGECVGHGLKFEDSIAVQDAYMSDGCDLFRHSHDDEVEFLIIYEGELKVEVDNKLIILKAGDSIKFEKGVLHHATTDTGCKMIAVTIPASAFYPKEG